MHMKLFAVDAQSHGSALVLRTRISAAFRQYSKDPLIFSDYPSFHAMATALDGALKSSDVILVLASLEAYGETKDLLMRSLHMKTEHRFDVFERAEQALGEWAMSSPQAAVHIEFPVDAEVFITEDGLFSGFCTDAGGQSIFFLPYDEHITVPLLKNGVTEHLKKLSQNRKYRLGHVPFLHQDICEILAAAGLQVAVAKTASSGFIYSPAKKIEGFHRYFLPYEGFEKRGEQALDKYTVKLAIDGSRSLDCPYGIALSNIASKGRERKIHFAVASRKTFSAGCLTADFSADDVGKIDDFFAEGVNSLFSLLKKRLFDENIILRRKY